MHTTAHNYTRTHTDTHIRALLQSKHDSVTMLNDYVVLGSLGRGSYGRVKLCYHMGDECLYALKVRCRVCVWVGGPAPPPGGGGGGAGGGGRNCE